MATAGYWHPVPGTSVEAVSSTTNLHACVSYADSLWFAGGYGATTDDGCWIFRYSEHTNLLEKAFEQPDALLTNNTLWRSLGVHKGALLAGLGNQTNGAFSGQIYRYDGSAWTQVLNDGATQSIYRLFSAPDGYVYAGGGTSGGQGKMWRSLDGITWVELVNTADFEYVRAIAYYQGSVYFGSRGQGKVYRWDGSVGAYTEVLDPSRGQVKFLHNHGGLWYMGTISGDVNVWDPVTGETWEPWEKTSATPAAAENNVEGYDAAVYNGELYSSIEVDSPEVRAYVLRSQDNGRRIAVDGELQPFGKPQAMCVHNGSMWCVGTVNANKGWVAWRSSQYKAVVQRQPLSPIRVTTTSVGVTIPGPLAIKGLVWTRNTTNGHAITVIDPVTTATLWQCTRRGGAQATVEWSPPRPLMAPNGVQVSVMGSGELFIYV